MKKKASQQGGFPRRTREGSGEVIDTAIQWLIWLRSGSACRTDADEFRRWRAQSVEHAQAAYDVARLWQILGLLRSDDGMDGRARIAFDGVMSRHRRMRTRMGLSCVRNGVRYRRRVRGRGPKKKNAG
ncbi:FecR/PupR family sigma factor regulator [Trinickia fusca]|nr:FecR/PupR family sigma factor regulator [Trinickia fusca]